MPNPNYRSGGSIFWGESISEFKVEVKVTVETELEVKTEAKLEIQFELKLRLELKLRDGKVPFNLSPTANSVGI